MQLVLTAEPIDAQRALQCNLVMKVVPPDQLLDEAVTGRPADPPATLQRAVRSAKETILEVMGKPLEDRLRIEGWNSYTCADGDEAATPLEQFHDKSDAGRAGARATPLRNLGPGDGPRPERLTEARRR